MQLRSYPELVSLEDRRGGRFTSLAVGRLGRCPFCGSDTTRSAEIVRRPLRAARLCRRPHIDKDSGGPGGEVTLLRADREVVLSAGGVRLAQRSR